MQFRSILFLDDESRSDAVEPAYFRDLNLDQIVERIVAKDPAFDLRPLFYQTLSTVAGVSYRQEAMRDLEKTELLGVVRTFCDRMQRVRSQLAQRETLHYELQQVRWFLHAVETYNAAVIELSSELDRMNLDSGAFNALRRFLKAYLASAAFQSLLKRVRQLVSQLNHIRYGVFVGPGYVTVRPYQYEPDYSSQIIDTFGKFRRETVRDYRKQFADHPQMNHVEEAILGFVEKLHPNSFASLRAFAAENEDFCDATIERFDLEVRFYVTYLDHVATFRQLDLPFCYPEIAVDDKDLCAESTFDLALARKLVERDEPIVRNEFTLSGGERIFLVSGPNQGGKTTFARTFGQLHHLAALGLCVPGSRARLYAFDRLLTHFEREEHIDTLRGKLQDDLIRVREILNNTTARSIVIINEIFSSTTLADAMFLAEEILQRFITIDALCVCVTFLVDLAKLSPTIVSLVSEVLPEQPDTRTFKVIRARPDGRSYAETIAEKYRLTYDLVKKRIQS